MREQFEKERFLWIRRLLSAQEITVLRDQIDCAGVPGQRIDMGSSLGHFIARADWQMKIREIWPELRPVRIVLFDKDKAKNWAVPWHQDRVITVKDRVDDPCYQNWTRKAGCWHCEPPMEVLEKMLFTRLHLEACSAESGAMAFAGGSDCAGQVGGEDAETVAGNYDQHISEAEAGDLLILPMLTLHRSSASSTPESRLTIRIDYGPKDLPGSAEWAI